MLWPTSLGWRYFTGFTALGATWSRKALATTKTARGRFALRSPVRPNPIGPPIATLVGMEGTTLLVRGLDYLDGTPLPDIKPSRDLFTPLALQLRAIPM